MLRTFIHSARKITPARSHIASKTFFNHNFRDITNHHIVTNSRNFPIEITDRKIHSSPYTKVEQKAEANPEATAVPKETDYLLKIKVAMVVTEERKKGETKIKDSLIT